MHPDMDILVVLSIVEAERVREVWNLVAFSVVFLFSAVAFGFFVHRFRNVFSSAVSFLMKPRNVVVTTCVAAAIIYGSTKSDVKVPQTHQSDFRQTTSSLVEPASGTVEYWQSDATTNGIQVALFGGTVTQSLDFVAGQFVYAFDSSTSVSTPQGLPGNKLWCRTSQSSNWVATTTHSYFNTNGHYSAAIASLPENRSPSYYQLWFVGPEENLPPVVVEVTGGIDILNCTITSSSVSVTFHGTDVRFGTGSHTYYFQSRANIDGVLTEWQTISSITLTSGQTTGTITVPGFTVDKYHQYRVYSDLEVAE